ncbi:protein kinase domain-containing protein [Candidatus Poriferisodalis sp.]|uniref:protein kinase domain-containing protein n=1 Tax=Candidatus Poriferisodalis sp. TaxID=3101277 RepID=UPI003B02D0F3
MEHAVLQGSFPELAVERHPLGEGRIKIAYGATWDGVPVVLKLVKTALVDDSDGAVQIPERTEREILALAKVSSPRVAQVLREPQIRVVDGEKFLSFLEQRYSDDTLLTRMTSEWHEDRVVDLVHDLLDAVAALTAADLVHRDIKPTNIVFDENDRPVLLDLDAALHQDLDPLTSESLTGPGTDRYAAPEQFLPRGQVKPDFRSDLYSVGVVAFEALTGAHPFGHPGEEWYQRMTRGNLDINQLRRRCGRPLQELLARLLLPEPNQRYRKISLAIEDLEHCR